MRIYLRLTDHLYRGEVIRIADLESFGAIYVGDNAPERLGFYSRVSRIRASAHASVNRVRHRLGYRSSALFGALFLGLVEERLDDFRYFVRRAGCIHLLALSGMHVGVLIGAVLAILSPLVGLRAARVVTLPVVAGYVFLIGAPPALLRAGVMYGIATLLLATRRRARTVDAIAAAFVIAVLGQPESVATLSFQLTYLAVAGIVVGSTAWTKWLRRGFPNYVASALGVSFAAYTVTVPLVGYAFGETYPFGILAGLVLGPAVSIFLIASAVVVAAELISPRRTLSFRLLYDLLEYASRIIESAAEVLSRFPMLRVHPMVLVICSVFMWIYILREFGDRDKL